jgi:hypothetical protein
MLKVILVLALTSSTLSPDYDLHSYEAEQTTLASQKVAVRPEDLPEAVKTALSGEGYAEYKVTNAYLVTRDDRSQYYEINLRKGEETATINLDKYGKKVD